MVEKTFISEKTNKIKKPFSFPGSRNIMRRLVHKKLNNLNEGSIEIIEGNSKKTFGNVNSKLSVKISIYSSEFYSLLLTKGSIGALESYIEGHWSCNDLVALSRMIIRDDIAADNLEKGFAMITKPLLWLYIRLNPNTKVGSKKNIRAHYDLSNDFFKVFLDKTLTYSCAIFSKPEMSLRDAQIEKLDRLCRKIGLTSQDTLLEIGTGWGSFAIHAAKNYGCSITTTTICLLLLRLATCQENA